MLDEIGGTFVIVYIGGPLCAGTWTPEIVQEYVAAGITEFMPTYVGSQNGPGEVAFAEAQDAVRLMKSFGWEPGGVPCWNDIEAPAQAGAENYARAWCEVMRREGYLDGLYGPNEFLARCAGVNQPSQVWFTNWLYEEIRSDLDPATMPGFDEAIFAGECRAWQYTLGDVRIQGVQVDGDVADCVLAGPPGTPPVPPDPPEPKPAGTSVAAAAATMLQ